MNGVIHAMKGAPLLIWLKYGGYSQNKGHFFNFADIYFYPKLNMFIVLK